MLDVSKVLISTLKIFEGTLNTQRKPELWDFSSSAGERTQITWRTKRISTGTGCLVLCRTSEYQSWIFFLRQDLSRCWMIRLYSNWTCLKYVECSPNWLPCTWILVSGFTSIHCWRGNNRISRARCPKEVLDNFVWFVTIFSRINDIT